MCRTIAFQKAIVNSKEQIAQRNYRKFQSSSQIGIEFNKLKLAICHLLSAIFRCRSSGARIVFLRCRVTLTHDFSLLPNQIGSRFSTNPIRRNGHHKFRAVLRRADDADFALVRVDNRADKT